MTIKLQRLKVVKEVDSEEKAKKLEELGFKRMKEAEKEKAPAGKKNGKNGDKKPEADKKEEGDGDGSGAAGEDNSGGNGQS